MVSFRSISSREHALAVAFADLADTLAADHDVSATLQRLCQHCVDLLDIAAAGVLLVEQGRWNIEASSNEPARLLLQHSDGPELYQECARTGTPVLFPDVAADLQAWPRFVVKALEQGIASAYLLPMRLRAATQGVLGLFSTQSDSLTGDRIKIAQALADAIMAGITQHRALHRADTRAGQLQQALDSRVLIEQAKGVLSQHGRIGIDHAFRLLRQYARSHNQSLHQLATQIVTDRTLVDDVLATTIPDPAARTAHISRRTPRTTS